MTYFFEGETMDIWIPRFLYRLSPYSNLICGGLVMQLAPSKMYILVGLVAAVHGFAVLILRHLEKAKYINAR